MFFYISFVALSAFSLDIGRKYKKDARVAMFLFFSIIFIGNAIILTNLPDISAYEESYEGFRKARALDEHMEPGYMLVSSLFARIDFPFYAYRCLLIFCSTALFFRGIIRLSEQFSISVIYFYTCVFVISYLIQVRVGLGLSVFVGFGLPSYCQKNSFFVFLSIVIASFFHISMLALFLSLFFTAFPRNKKFKYFALLCGLLFVFLNVFELLLNIAETYFLHTKVMSYINQSGDKDALFSARDILNFCLLLYFSSITNANEFDNLMFWNLFCGFFLKIIFRNFGEVGVRFNLLFSYSLVFLMPLLCKNKNILKVIFAYLFAFVNFYFWITNYGSGSIIKNGGLSL